MKETSSRKTGISIEPKMPLQPQPDLVYNVKLDATRNSLGKNVPSLSKQVSRETMPYGSMVAFGKEDSHDFGSDSLKSMHSHS